MLQGGFVRIKLQLSDIENITIIVFWILNIKISFVINSYIIHLNHIGCMIFGIRRKTILKNMPEKTLYQAGITSQFGRILGRHTSRRIYEWNIFNTWCPIILHDAYNLVRGFGADKFTVRLPCTSAASFCSFHMWSEW